MSEYLKRCSKRKNEKIVINFHKDSNKKDDFTIKVEFVKSKKTMKN